jgi:hypothetical protein
MLWRDGRKGDKGGEEGLTTQVSLRAAHSINSTYPQYPMAQLAKLQQGIGSQVVRKIMFFFVMEIGFQQTIPNRYDED